MWVRTVVQSKNNPFLNVDERVKMVAGFIANATIIVGTVASVVNLAVTPLVDRLSTIEQSSTRSELLTLMANYPEDKRAIEELAYHYFAELNGDSYVYGVYGRWADEHNVDYKNITELHNLNK